MAHARARLTFLSRCLLVERVLENGWKPQDAAKAMGVSRQTVYKWLRRYREDGTAGLHDRSSAPRRCLHALSPEEVAAIVAARLATLHGPHRLSYRLGRHRSTIYGVLRREQVNRLSFIDRPTRTVVRYERERPGELVHIDVKKLGRIREGGGWRMLGRQPGHRGGHDVPVGFDYLHVAVDDHSRYAYVEVHPDEKGPTCAGFLERMVDHLAVLGVEVEGVMTDNARNYVVAKRFKEALGARRHLVTRPYRPQTNGKAERFNRTLLEEFAYKSLFKSNVQRTLALGPWLDSYNAERNHTAIGGLTPLQRLVNNADGTHS